MKDSFSVAAGYQLSSLNLSSWLFFF